MRNLYMLGVTESQMNAFIANPQKYYNTILSYDATGVTPVAPTAFPAYNCGIGVSWTLPTDRKTLNYSQGIEATSRTMVTRLVELFDGFFALAWVVPVVQLRLEPNQWLGSGSLKCNLDNFLWDLQHLISGIFHILKIFGWDDDVVKWLNTHKVPSMGKVWELVATCSWEAQTLIPGVVEMFQVMTMIGNKYKPGNANQRLATVTHRSFKQCSDKNWYIVADACNKNFRACTGIYNPLNPPAWAASLEDISQW